MTPNLHGPRLVIVVKVDETTWIPEAVQAYKRTLSRALRNSYELEQDPVIKVTYRSRCAMAVSFYKLIAERGAWDDDLIHDGELRWKIGTDKAKEDAILRWWIAAERGYETAQNNLAYILDQGTFLLRHARSFVQTH